MGVKIEITVDPLAIRQKCEVVDDDGAKLEAPFKSMSCSMECLVSSTLLANKQLEEIEEFCLWQEDIASISSWDLCKQFIHDMQGLSTQACKSFVVLNVFESKEETLQWDIDEGSSLVSTISTLQFS